MSTVEQNSLNSFTRGGQFLNNFFVMAKQNIIRIFVTGLIVTIGAGWVSWYKNAAPHSRYTLINEGIMRVTLMINKDANKDISVMTFDGTRTVTTVQQRLNVPTYAADVKRMERDFKRAFYVGLFWGLLAMFGITWIAARIGFSLGKDKHVRGARLQSPRVVQKLIAKYNDKQAIIQNNPDYIPYALAGVDYPFRAETQHTMMVGSTGSGKTQGISVLLTQIYERGDRGVFYDKMRSFIERYYDPSRDIILNPLDARCPAWDMFADARHLVDWENIAEAIIPNEDSKNPYFEQTARTVFAHTAQRVVKRCEAKGTRPKISDLIFMLSSSSNEGLNEFLKGSPAERHIDPANERTTGSIRSTLVNSIRSLGYLKDPDDDNPGFSIRRWIKDDDRASVVYLTSRDDIHAVLQPLLTMWISIFTSALMSQPRSSKRIVWFGLDELPSLNRLPNLESALAEARQYGAAYLIGIQLISQLRQIYGKDGADTILGLTRNKLVFNPGDPITAELMTQFIGKSEVNRKDHSMSVGATELRDGQSVSNRLTQEFIIMPEELSQLPSLVGILSFTGDFPVCKITLDYLSLEGPEDGFVEDEFAIKRAEDMYSRASAAPIIEHVKTQDVTPSLNSLSAIDARNAEAARTDVPYDNVSGNDQYAKSGYAYDQNGGDISGYGQAHDQSHISGYDHPIQDSDLRGYGAATKPNNIEGYGNIEPIENTKGQTPDVIPADTHENPLTMIEKSRAKIASERGGSKTATVRMTTVPADHPKPILTTPDAPPPPKSDSGSGNAPGHLHHHDEAKAFADAASGLAPGITANALDMRTVEQSSDTDDDDEEYSKAAEKRRLRELELFGEVSTAMPAHGGRDNVPDHFGGGE